MESQSTEKLPGAPPPPSRHKVLIVDDDANLCQMLKDILEEYNYDAVAVETQEAALSTMREFHPILALVDFRLGDVTGIEVAHSLKAIDEDLPVILMTAYPSLDLAVKAIHSDIYDFLAKPVDNTYLLRSMSKAIEKRLLSEENKQLIRNLKASNAELEKLNRLKSKFLSIVTHDLRLPLTSIRGYAEMLDMDGLTPDDRAKCLSSIAKSVERMGDLIKNLMDMVSIEAGKMRVEKAVMDYKALFQELQQTHAPVAEPRQIQMRWELPPEPVQVFGDSNRLVQVLNNLISNAFKHIPDGGQITVRVGLTAEAGKPVVLTEVMDNGEGISAEDQARIFEQFYQVESSPTRRQGLGLGLNISKEIVASHDGRIGVSSDGLGKGSRFWFSLPQHRP